MMKAKRKSAISEASSVAVRLRLLRGIASTFFSLLILLQVATAKEKLHKGAVARQSPRGATPVRRSPSSRMPAASPLCFTNVTARASVQQFQSPTKSLDDNFIHVCFYDTRKRPDVPAMLRAAALFNTSGVKLCALLSHPPREETAGLRIVPLRVTGAADCLYAGLSRLSHGPGPQYLMKPLLGWVMPPEVQRVILLDTDTVVLRPISELWDEFGRFDGAMIGVVAEQSNLYQEKSDWRLIGKNGGVQLLDLQAMRTSEEYAHALDHFASGNAGEYIGFLGDQTLYTVMEGVYPHLFYRIGCEWNRQLSMHFGFRNASVHTCSSPCSILHANYGPLKCVAQLMQSSPTCTTWQRFQDKLGSGAVYQGCPGHLPQSMQNLLKKVIRRFFADCCIANS